MAIPKPLYVSIRPKPIVYIICPKNIAKGKKNAPAHHTANMDNAKNMNLVGTNAQPIQSEMPGDISRQN